MKNYIAAGVLVVLMFWILTVNADTWPEFKNKTYLGGYYFAVCEVCLKGGYNNDTPSTLWQCSQATKEYEKGCAKGILEAILYRPTLTQSK